MLQSVNRLKPVEVSVFDATPLRRFPGQHQVSGSSKIPSIIYYDFSGKVQAIGAEAIQDETVAEDGERIKVEW